MYLRSRVRWINEEGTEMKEKENSEVINDNKNANACEIIPLGAAFMLSSL